MLQLTAFVALLSRHCLQFTKRQIGLLLTLRLQCSTMQWKSIQTCLNEALRITTQCPIISEDHLHDKVLPVHQHTHMLQFQCLFGCCSVSHSNHYLIERRVRKDLHDLESEGERGRASKSRKAAQTSRVVLSQLCFDVGAAASIRIRRADFLNLQFPTFKILSDSLGSYNY